LDNLGEQAWVRSRETVRRAHGRPSLATIRELLPNADHAAENSFVERMEIEDVDGVIALPGAFELLQTLPANRWTIVTSCTGPLALVRLRVAGLPIPAQLVTSNDILNGKPDPEPYMKGAKLLGIAASDCTVIEDAPAGIRAGKAAVRASSHCKPPSATFFCGKPAPTGS